MTMFYLQCHIETLILQVEIVLGSFLGFGDMG